MFPPSLESDVVFDQSQFVKTAIRDAAARRRHRPFLTSLMILLFLGSMRATVAVSFSIPISVLATLSLLQIGGSSINTMVLGGLALALSRLIDNSVVVLENIHRHLELGDPPVVAAEKGGREVALPVLAATLTTVVVFFPVTLLFGVSKFLFSSLALAVVLSLIRFLCGRDDGGAAVLRALHAATGPRSRGSRLGRRFNAGFNRGFESS
jgi:multidrug efflux pump subunit AcrB